MNLAVIAEPDLRERMRCIRVIADQTPISALGAASWHELDQVLVDTRDVGLIFYAHPLAGAPDDAIALLLSRTKRLVLAVTDGAPLPSADGFTRTTRPIAEETLVMMARALAAPSTPPPANLDPASFEHAAKAQLEERIKELNRDARRLLLTRNYAEAARLLVTLSELEPTSHLVRANLEQLRRLGFPK